MKINTLTIPYAEMRYKTVGDWWFDGETLEVRVALLNDWRMEMSVAYHEIREALVCKLLLIDEKVVTEFDETFEKIRAEYPKIIGNQEPGDMISSPYNFPHTQATKDEKGLVEDLKVDWLEYENKINSI